MKTKVYKNRSEPTSKMLRISFGVAYPPYRHIENEPFVQAQGSFSMCLHGSEQFT